MLNAKLYDHLRNVTERLDLITVELLSADTSARMHLMAERNFLLADVNRTCKKLERKPAQSFLRRTLSLQPSMWLVK